MSIEQVQPLLKGVPMHTVDTARHRQNSIEMMTLVAIALASFYTRVVLHEVGLQLTNAFLVSAGISIVIGQSTRFRRFENVDMSVPLTTIAVAGIALLMSGEPAFGIDVLFGLVGGLLWKHRWS